MYTVKTPSLGRLLVGLLCVTFSAGLGVCETGTVSNVVPSELCRGLWLVPIEYGSNGRLTMVLDTGASTSSVDPDAIERLFGRRIRQGKSFRLKGGKAGPLSLRKLPVHVQEMDHLAQTLGKHFDGILGMSAFRSLLLTLDYPAQQIRVSRGTLASIDDGSIVRDIGKSRPFIALDVEGTMRPVLIDSGSTGAIRMQPGDIESWLIEPRPTSSSAGYDEMRLDVMGRAAKPIQLGGVQVPEPIVQIKQRARIIGYKIMHRFRWTFDRSKRRIRIEPNGLDPIETRTPRGIGAALAPVSDGFEVRSVFEGGPADNAGLAVGDRIVAVDGKPIRDRQDCAPGLLSSGAEQVTLTVRNDDGQREVETAIVDLVR